MSGGGGSVSGSVAIGLPGSNPPADLESPGAQSSSAERSNGLSFGGGNSTNMFSDQKPFVARSREMRNGSMVSRTQVRDGNMDVLIEEISDKGYVITIREQLKTRSKNRRVQAKDIEELEQKYPVAYEWVRKYHLAGVTLDEESEDEAAGPGPQIGRKRRETTTRSSHSFSASGGGASGGSSAGGSNGFGGFSTGGGATGNQAMEMMEQQILQQIQQTDNPLLREHMRSMLQQMRQSKNQGNGNQP